MGNINLVNKEIGRMLEDLVRDQATPFESWGHFIQAHGEHVYFIDDDDLNRVVVRVHVEKVLNFY